MAKQKKKHKRNLIMGRSDIPYAQRMAMKHQADIMFIIIVVMLYSCIKISGDCSREEEKEDG